MRAPLLCCFLVIGNFACASDALEPAEYPEIKVNAQDFSLDVKDPRKELEEPTLPPHSMYKNDKASAPRALPAAFQSGAQQRLSKLSTKQGLPLKVNVTVKQADVTFFNDYRGDFTRFDVSLGISVTTDKGVQLVKGTGASWQELPSSEASLKEQQRVFEFTALDAFDRYFADEKTLNKLNMQINAYRKAHPDG